MRGMILALFAFACLSASGCNSAQKSCTGCVDDPPRVCGSSCLTRISASDAGTPPFECACVAGQCGNDLVTYALVCDDNFCQCSATGVIGNAGGQFASPTGLCESDVSVIEGLFKTRCNFPPK